MEQVYPFPDWLCLPSLEFLRFELNAVSSRMGANTNPLCCVKCYILSLELSKKEMKHLQMLSSCEGLKETRHYRKKKAE